MCRRPTRRQAPLLLTLAILAAPALAADHALLIGVSEYPALGEDAQLQGPRNDVRLMRDLLLRRGFEPGKIPVLADGVDGAGLPTRGAILNALDDLAGRLNAGDRLYLHLSGHGTRQPNVPDPADPHDDHEADGLDEVFLPRDAADWDPALAEVRNGIRDDEIGARIGRLQARAPSSGWWPTPATPVP